MNEQVADSPERGRQGGAWGEQPGSPCQEGFGFGELSATGFGGGGGGAVEQRHSSEPVLAGAARSL